MATLPHVNPLDLISDTWANSVIDAINALQTATTDPTSRVARGKVGLATVTANQGGITTLADITGLTVTFASVSGRLYRVFCETYMQHSVANAVVNLQLLDGAGVQMQSSQVTCVNTSQPIRISCTYIIAGTGASLTYKARAVIATAGTITVVATPSAPSYLVAEDIGAI